MPRLPPETLREIFRYLKVTSDSELDLMSASLVCTSWNSQGFPFVSLSDLDCLYLRDNICTIRLQRILLLLAESRRLGLDYCDFIYKIDIRLNRVNDNALAGADLICKITSLGLPNLHKIHLLCLIPLDIIIDICPSDQPITKICLECLWKDNGKICLFLLNRFKATLRELYIYHFSNFNLEIQDAITQCIERVHLECNTLPPFEAEKKDSLPTVSNTSEIVIRHATAFSNLVCLIIYEKVSGVQFCEFITQCPRIENIILGVDNTFDDGCLRFLAQNTPNLMTLYLPCMGVRGEEVWMAGDVRWQKLKSLHLNVTDISSFFWEQIFHVCTKLVDISFNRALPIEIMVEHGFYQHHNTWLKEVE